jgi:hypothetical protein
VPHADGLVRKQLLKEAFGRWAVLSVAGVGIPEQVIHRAPVLDHAAETQRLDAQKPRIGVARQLGEHGVHARQNR